MCFFLENRRVEGGQWLGFDILRSRVSPDVSHESHAVVQLKRHREPSGRRHMKHQFSHYFRFILAITFLACGSAEAKDDLNLLLITIDTLRADHLGCYGYKGVETPNIDKLAEKGTRFVNTYAQVPFTLPSHASLFTSTYPMWNGVRDNAGPPLPEENVTLAEVLKQNGYATAAFTAAFVVDSFFQLNQGFDTYHDNFPPRDSSLVPGEEGGLQRRADEVLVPALAWIDKNAERKFFTWVHFYDPHHPYNPPEPYRSQYRSCPYDGEIAYVDSVVGKLFNFLSEKRLTKKTVIVIVSDHGEALGEHGESYHGYYLYDSTLRVPFILSVPGLPSHAPQVALPVSLLDVAPTLLQVLGIPRPAQMQGRSLLASILGREQDPEPIYGESLFANLHFGWGTLYAFRLGHHKLIQSKRPELFDLEKDPGEKINLFAENRALATTLREKLEAMATRYRRDPPEKAAPKLSQEALNKLRALGYIGAPSEATQSMTADLPDPRGRIHFYNLYLQAASQQGNGRLVEAAATYLLMLHEDPTLSIVHHQLGSVYFKMKKYPMAVESFQAALKLNAKSDASILALARTYGEMGKYPEAESGYERALALKPDDPANLDNLAVILMKMGSWDKAKQTLEHAVALGSPLKESFYHLGVCYQRDRRLDEAAAQFRKAIEIDSKFAGAYYNLGVIYAQQGKQNAAIEEFQKAVEAKPNFAEPHFNLGSIYARQDKLTTAAAEFEKAVELRPDLAEAHFNLGTVYARQARLGDSIAEYKKATAIQPSFAKAHRGLAKIYEQKGMLEQAKTETETAQELEKQTNSN
jgi:arylsulfatase A-like enzyme/tetratricopeptide (TPR) repeat protein